MVNLLTEAAPCLILLDETLEYLNKALGMRAHDGNLAATTLTVIKGLCTAASNVRGAAIIATLTSSRLEDYATVAGEEMQERLSKVVGRTENIVTPVEGDDIFPILHTRLFESMVTSPTVERWRMLTWIGTSRWATYFPSNSVKPPWVWASWKLRGSEGFPRPEPMRAPSAALGRP
jgi:hypothetical protein